MFERFRELLGSRDRLLAHQAVTLMSQLPLDDERFEPWVGRTGEGSHALALLLRSKNKHLKEIIADLIKCNRGGEVRINSWLNSPISYADLNTSCVERLTINCHSSVRPLKALTQASDRLTHLIIEGSHRHLFDAKEVKALAEYIEPLSGLMSVELLWISGEGLIELVEHPKLLSLLSSSLRHRPPNASRLAILRLTPAAVSALERCETLRGLVEVDQLTAEGLASLTLTSPLLASLEERYAQTTPTPERQALTLKALEGLPKGAPKSLKARLSSLGARALYHRVELEVLNTSVYAQDSSRSVDLSMHMSLCPAGRFWMGAPEGRGRDNARPCHEVLISEALWVSQTTLSHHQLLAICDLAHHRGLDLTGLPSTLKSRRGQEPLTSITWLEAVYTCNLISQLASLTPVYHVEVNQNRFGYEIAHVLLNREADGYRLPSEAEWAYFARAQQEHIYAGADELQEVAWFGAGPAGGHKRAKRATASSSVPYPAALKRPNAWGLYDLSGNVLEWCQDAWLEDAYAQRPDESPLVDPLVWSTSANHRVVRGGHFKGGPILCELHHRSKQAERSSSAHCGVRFVRRATALDTCERG